MNDLEQAAKEEEEFLKRLDDDMVSCWECGKRIETSEVFDIVVNTAEDIVCKECRGINND